MAAMILLAMPVTVLLISIASLVDPGETGSVVQVVGLAAFMVYLHGILPALALAAVHTVIRRANRVTGLALSIGAGTALGAVAGWAATLTAFVPALVGIAVGAFAGLVFGAVVPRAAPVTAAG